MTEEKVLEGTQDIEFRIKVAYQKRHMTQKQLAKDLNINPQVLNRAIKGYMNPQSIEIRRKLKQLLDY